MLKLASIRPEPVIENLAAENVPANAPGVSKAPFAQNLPAHAYLVEVRYLKGGVFEIHDRQPRNHEGVMVRGLVAAIAAQKRDGRPAVGQCLHVGGDQPQRIDIKARSLFPRGGSQHHVAKAQHA